MRNIGRISFVALDGDPPAEQALDQLPPAQAVCNIVRQAFAPFLDAAAAVETWDGASVPAPPPAGLHLVYVYGHMWLDAAVPHAAWRVDGSPVRGDAATLLAHILPTQGLDRTLLFFDCCHAAAFDAVLPPDQQLRLIVYASAADEKAIALTRERATRLSLALAAASAKAGKSLDLVRVLADVAEHLSGDGMVRGQTVSYSMHGPAIRLERASQSGPVQRETAVARMRNTVFTAGGTVALLAAIAIWFYWSHVLLEIDLSHLAAIGNDIHVTVSRAEPENNAEYLVSDHAAGAANRVRVWAPAANLLIRVKANYTDGAERALNTHLLLHPGFDWGRKHLAYALPSSTAISTHPGMAYVPAANWFHAREREARNNPQGFWVDLRPPTVDAYEPRARSLFEAGALKQDNSFLLSWRQRSAAVEAVGLHQLGSLNRALGDIFGAVAAANSTHVEAAGDIVVGPGALPCASCPAPMTRLEAALYCSSRSMRLPTDLEWEFAVRGVDGRDYPWGNRFDSARANAPGLPEKGAPPPALKPVDAYPDQRSPFGLVDTVGNAGDWVSNASGSYERIFMGATYRFNPEDATAFRMQPVTEADYLIREITARCVADARR